MRKLLYLFSCFCLLSLTACTHPSANQDVVDTPLSETDEVEPGTESEAEITSVSFEMLTKRSALIRSDIYVNTGNGIRVYHSDTNESEVILEQEQTAFLCNISNRLFYFGFHKNEQSVPFMDTLYSYDLNTQEASAVMDLPEGTYAMGVFEDYLYLFQMTDVGTYEAYSLTQDGSLTPATNAPALDSGSNYFKLNNYEFMVGDSLTNISISLDGEEILSREDFDHDYIVLSCSSDYLLLSDEYFDEDEKAGTLYAFDMKTGDFFIEICSFSPTYAEFNGDWVIIYSPEEGGYTFFNLNTREKQNPF